MPYTWKTHVSLKRDKPLYHFSLDGADISWTSCYVVEVFVEDGEDWIGNFEGGSDVFRHPDPNRICVNAFYKCYIIDVYNPRNYETIDTRLLYQHYLIEELGIIVFAGSWKIIAYSKEGLLWQAECPNHAELSVYHIEDDVLYGRILAYWLATRPEFTVDLRTGENNIAERIAAAPRLPHHVYSKPPIDLRLVLPIAFLIVLVFVLSYIIG